MRRSTEVPATVAALAGLPGAAPVVWLQRRCRGSEAYFHHSRDQPHLSDDDYPVAGEFTAIPLNGTSISRG